MMEVRKEVKVTQDLYYDYTQKVEVIFLEVRIKLEKVTYLRPTLQLLFCLKFSGLQARKYCIQKELGVLRWM